MTPSPCGIADANALKAFADTHDSLYAPTKAALLTLPARPLLITPPALTEALYLLHGAGGWPLQNVLWQAIRIGVFLVADFVPPDALRCDALMKKYADLPCDFADASIVSLAERTGLRLVLTFDSDFYAYRLADGQSLIVTPGTPPTV